MTAHELLTKLQDLIDRRQIMPHADIYIEESGDEAVLRDLRVVAASKLEMK